MSLHNQNNLDKHPIENGIIKVCILVFLGAKIGNINSFSRIPSRVKSEIEAANTIWKYKENGRIKGVSFEIVKVIFLDNHIKDVGGNLKDFPWRENIGQLLFEMGKKLCSTADVYIFYMNGDHIGPIHLNGSHTDAITFRDVPIIILSNGASSQKYILAHELGHFMYLNNLYGNIKDPNPFPGDPDHNADPNNLMFPVSDYWPTSPKAPSITSSQIHKALNNRFFY